MNVASSVDDFFVGAASLERQRSPARLAVHSSAAVRRQIALKAARAFDLGSFEPRAIMSGSVTV
jgi:hypothetical protein